MLDIIILIAAVLLGCGKSLLMRAVSSSVSDKKFFWRNNAIIFLMAFILTLILSDKGEIMRLPSAYTVILSALFAIFTAAAQLLYIIAQSKGGVSLNTFIYSCGFVIPAIYGMLSDPKSINIFRIAAFVLIILLLYIYILPKKNRVSLVWLGFIASATFLSGIIAIVQTMHQTSEYKGELSSFLVLAFAICTLISLFGYIYYLLKSKKQKKSAKKAAERHTEKIVPLICGLNVGILNRCTLYLSGALPSIVFFPVYNAAVVILTGFFASFLYNEKLEARQKICLALSIIPLVLSKL